MNRNSVHSCPSCNTLHTQVLEETTLLACKNCGEIVFQNIVGYEKPMPSKVPEDWSFVKVGSSGLFQKKTFTIIGRIRLQLRNEYKNFWCAEVENGKSQWIMESFGSFSVLNPPWHTYTKDASKLRAGQSIEVATGLKYKGEYVERCEGISYEGEIGAWKLFTPGFFLIQASRNDRNTTIFTIEKKENVEYLTGSIVLMEELNLQNIVEWNDWK